MHRLPPHSSSPSLELTGKRVALERNGEIVPRSSLEQQELSDGDRVEIVVAVGGG